MKRPILAAAAAALLVAAILGAPQQAEARRGYGSAGIIGGISANEIIARGAYYPGFGAYPAPANYAGPAYYPAPTYPPPGCVITQRRFMAGYRWEMRKIRVCY
jgi:hypothetical protein